MTYTIKASACKGCMLCKKACPAEAIMGELKTPHYIIQDKCIGCGACVSTCKFAAVVVE